MERVGKNLRTKMLVVWAVSMFVPIILIFIFNYIQYGNFIEQSGKGIQERLQMYELNQYEKVGRIINNVIMENPDLFLEEEIESYFEDVNGVDTLELLVVIRKDDEMFTPNDFQSPTGEEVLKSFQEIEHIKLPEFGSSQFKNNELVLKSTGYLIARQIDFLFKDDSKGSVFVLKKYVDIPLIIAKVFTENFIFIAIVTLLITLVGMNKMAKFILEPIYEIIKVTDKVSNNDFSGRIRNKTRDETLIKLVSAINNMNEKLEVSQKENINLENQRKEFIAAISHDIKTPLTAINMNVGALKDGIATSPDKAEKYFSNIIKKTGDINTMINELSLYSDLETGVEDYKFEAVDLDWFVKDIIEESVYGFGSEIGNIEYNNFLTPKTMKDIDADKFKRFMINTISNSIKYASVDDVQITITLNNISNTDKIKMIIEDNGLGLETEKLDKIFDKFYRADEARNQNQHGSGLGLAICKSIIEKHLGSIKAESEVGKYFRIVVEF